jgi:hypothetical protein
MKRLIAFTAFLILSIAIQPLSGQDLARAANDPGNFVFPDGGNRLAAENEIRRLEFTSAGMKFVDKAAADPRFRRSFEFRFKSVAVGDSVWVAEDDHGSEPFRQTAEVFYARSGSVAEKYQPTERGVEHHFVIRDNVTGLSGDLEITGEVATTTLLEQRAVKTLSALSFYSEHGPAINFGPVVASDAKGRQSEVEVRFEGRRLTLVVDGAWLKDAAYPVAVKSSIQTAAKRSHKPSVKTTMPASMDAIQANATGLVSIEDTPVWRAQIRILTAGTSTAETDDWVSVRLNSVNSTWLYSSVHKPLTSGHSHIFDLTLNGVKKLRDITNLQIFKSGWDEWGIKTLGLYVNGVEVYNIDFGYGRWLNPTSPSGSTHVVYHQDLRNHSLWDNVSSAPPTSISSAQLKSRIESIGGDYLVTNTISNGSTLRFNQSSDAIQVLGSGARTIRADIDLRYTYHHFSIWPWENKTIAYDVNAEVDMEFACSAGKIFVAPRGVDMTYPTVDPASQIDKLMLNMFLLTALPAKIHIPLQAVTYTNDLGQPACPAIRVENNSVYFD